SEHRGEMAKVNLGTAILPKKLNALAQITAKTVIWRQIEPPHSYQPGAMNRGHWDADYGMKRLGTAQTRTIRAPGEFDEGLAFQTARGDGPCNVHRGLRCPRPRRKTRCAGGRRQRLQERAQAAEGGQRRPHHG